MGLSATSPGLGKEAKTGFTWTKCNLKPVETKRRKGASEAREVAGRVNSAVPEKRGEQGRPQKTDCAKSHRLFTRHKEER